MVNWSFCSSGPQSRLRFAAIFAAMFIGPVFTREVTIAPRRDWTYIVRSVYAALLLLLVSTAWLVVSGTQLITDPGDFARFGAMLFQFLAPVQLVLAIFFAAILAAGAVGQEKDRKTLLLLLLTRMSNCELVLGKLFASLLNILMMLAVSIPVFMFIAMLGGVSYYQIFRVLLVTLFSMLACGSLGSCVALWRDKTFQALASTVLLLVIGIAVWEAIGFGLLGASIGGVSAQSLATWFSPWSAVVVASRPAVDADVVGPIRNFLIVCGAVTVLVNVVAIVMVRIWNPSRETRPTTLEEDTWHREHDAAEQTLADALAIDVVAQYEELTAQERADDRAKSQKITAEPGRVRHAWDNPIIWREIMTRAYGRRAWVIRLAFLAFFGMCVWTLHTILTAHLTPTVVQLAGPLVPLFLLSLVLVNAQAITSQTSEKEGGTFDLILVSDITSKEYVLGKLGGVFYNMKEIVLLPLLLCMYLYWKQALEPAQLFFLTVGLIVVYAFVAMIGVYIGMQYENTRKATATSLGVVFFLFIGIAACIWIMVAFSGSFTTQLVPFSTFMIGGGIGLYITLGARNPSSAIATASFILPIAMFYIITTMLLGAYHLVFVVLVGAFGFTTAAMLVPAITEFDVATGRTTAD